MMYSVTFLLYKLLISFFLSVFQKHCYCFLNLSLFLKRSVAKRSVPMQTRSFYTLKKKEPVEQYHIDHILISQSNFNTRLIVILTAFLKVNSACKQTQ